jgi:hypothetical protein
LSSLVWEDSAGQTSSSFTFGRLQRSPRVSARHVGQVSLQLREVESWRKSGCLGFWRQQRVGFVYALIPPGPGGPLCISPRQYGHAGLVIGNSMDSVAVLGQQARRPGLVRVELLLTLLLDLET